jgi:hypothetical protein
MALSPLGIFSAAGSARLVEYLIIAGGGGGSGGLAGSYYGPGGGGGTSKTGFAPIALSTNFTVTVGAGGAINANGFSSTFSTITAGAGLLGVARKGGNNDDFQGFDPVTGALSGGGAGANATATSQVGGAGLTSSISGSSVQYGGGGGGGGARAAGGAGGGGAGAQDGPAIDAIAGTANRGGGGGGGTDSAPNGLRAAGGSGIVILSYPLALTITIGAGLTGSTSTVGANKVTTITAGTGNVSWAA